MAWERTLRSPLGFVFLIIFLFLLFGRICDFYLSALHLPLVFSSFSLLAVLLSGALPLVLRSRITKFLLLYTAWLWIDIPFSLWKGGSFGLVLNGWSRSLGAFFVVAALTLTISHTTKVIRTILYSMIVAALLALLFGVSAAGRLMHPTGLYAGPNDLASAMMLGSICAWFVFSNPRHSLFLRIFGLFSLSPLFYVMVKTGSRAALIALLVIFLFIFKRYSLDKRIVLFLVVSVGLFATTAALPRDVFHRYFTLFSEHLADVTSEQEAQQRMMTVGSSNTRLYMIMASLRLTVTHPLFGVGPGQFMVAENTVARLAGKPRGVWLGTHNTYTEISSEAGIPALIFYLCCMFQCRRELVTVEKLCRGFKPTLQIAEISTTLFTLKMILLCFALFYMFEHSGYSPFFPAVAGLILAFGRAARWELARLQNAEAATMTPVVV